MAKAIAVALLIAACIALAGITSAAPLASIAHHDEEFVELVEDAAEETAPLSPVESETNPTEVDDAQELESVQEGHEVASSPLTVAGASKPLGVASDGLQLFQGTAAWATFQNLPSVLIGLTCLTSMNEGQKVVSITVHNPTKVYMIKHDAWTHKSVDVSGWIQVDSGMYLLESGWSAPAPYKLYSNIVPAGTHVLDTLSALYLFDTNWFQRQQISASGIDDGREIVAKVTLAGSFQGTLATITSASGFQTYITGSAWLRYSNLPSYLVGTTTYTNINEGSSGYLVSFTLSHPTMVYLMRDNVGWNPVPLSGWEKMDSGGYLAGASTMTVFKQILPAGTQSLNTGSAFYFFDLAWISKPSNRMYAFADSVQITSGARKPMGIAQNGLQLYIPDVWSVYQNLPPYLIGKLTTTSINDGTVCFEIKVPTKSYLMRAASGWNAVDLTGWTLVSSGNFLSGYSQIDVYTQVLPSGKNCLSTSSAMYLFDIQFWRDGTQTSIGVDGEYRKKIDTIIAGAVAGITAMLKTVQTVYDNAATAHSVAKSDNDKAVASFTSSKSNWEAAVSASERAKTTCTAATAARVSDQAAVNSAVVDWNSRKAQNEKELEMIAQVQNMVKQMIAIPASSSLEISQHKSGASALANTLLQHPSERMQLVGQSLSLLLQTERSSSEATEVLKLLESLAAKLRAEQSGAASSIKTFSDRLSASTAAASAACETSRIRSIEADDAKAQYSTSETVLASTKASLERRASGLNAADADLKATQASYKKEKSYLDTFSTCGAAAASAWSGSTGSALFLADYYFSYYDWNNGHSPGLGKFFQNAFAAMTAGNKDKLVVASLKADRDSWTLDDNTQPFAQWIRTKAATVATINSVLQLDGNVHVFVIVMDGQRSKVPILSDEEGIHLKRWVNNGGRLFAFVGHEAEKSPGYTKVGTGYAKWASVNFGLNFIDATMCLSPGTATPTADFPKFFQDGPGGSIDPSAGAAYTWTSNCHESFQLQSGSKGKVVVRGSGNQNTGYNYNCGSGDESCSLTTNVEAVFFGDGV